MTSTLITRSGLGPSDVNLLKDRKQTNNMRSVAAAKMITEGFRVQNNTRGCQPPTTQVSDTADMGSGL
eukprot:1059635-Amphidinium_carterae.1